MVSVIKACRWTDSVMLRRPTSPKPQLEMVLTDPTFAFQLESYPDGSPTLILIQKEVQMSAAAPFLLTNPDFSKMDVVKA